MIEFLENAVDFIVFSFGWILFIVVVINEGSLELIVQFFKKMLDFFPMSLVEGIFLNYGFDEDLSNFIDKNEGSSRDFGFFEGEKLVGKKVFKNWQQFGPSHAINKWLFFLFDANLDEFFDLLM